MNSETIWAFDLGKGSIGDSPSPRWGEGGRRPDEVNPAFQFLHKASLLIPAKFWKIKMGLFRLRGSPVWKSSFALRLAAWLFPTIDTARLVLIRQKSTKPLS